MPPPAPPFDRAIALASTLHTLRARWLHTRCGCGAVEAHPVRLAVRERPEAAGSTLADAVVRLRCRACGSRPATVHLCENGHGPGPIVGRPEPGWSLLLHGDPRRLVRLGDQRRGGGQGLSRPISSHHVPTRPITPSQSRRGQVGT
jgi:hypothetical protein